MNYDRTTTLRYKRGLLGFAVYCRIVELCAASRHGRLRYDVDAIVWDLHDQNVDAAFVDSVVKDFDLFIVSDGYVEDVFCPSETYKLKEKEEKTKAARSEAGKRGAASRAANKAKKEETQKETSQASVPVAQERKPDVVESVAQKTNSANESPFEDDGYYRYQPRDKQTVAYDAKKLEAVRAAWNRIYKDVRGAKQTWFAPPQTLIEVFRAVEGQFEVKDFEDAFEMARKDPRITWKFDSAVKQVGFLLGKIETEKNAAIQKQKEQDERDGIDRDSQEYKENLAALDSLWESGRVRPEDNIYYGPSEQDKTREELAW